LDKLGTYIMFRVSQGYLTSNRYTVVYNFWAAVISFKDDIASCSEWNKCKQDEKTRAMFPVYKSAIQGKRTSRPKRNSYGVGNLVDTFD